MTVFQELESPYKHFFISIGIVIALDIRVRVIPSFFSEKALRKLFAYLQVDFSISFFPPNFWNAVNNTLYM